MLLQLLLFLYFCLLLSWLVVIMPCDALWMGLCLYVPAFLSSCYHFSFCLGRGKKIHLSDFLAATFIIESLVCCLFYCYAREKSVYGLYFQLSGSWRQQLFIVVVCKLMCCVGFWVAKCLRVYSLMTDCLADSKYVYSALDAAADDDLYGSPRRVGARCTVVILVIAEGIDGSS